MTATETPPRRRITGNRALRGITEDEFTALSAFQGEKCGCCRRPLSELTPRQIHLDHDHEVPGEGRDSIRGIVCASCNVRVGRFENEAKSGRVFMIEPEIQAYLYNPPARRVLSPVNTLTGDEWAKMHAYQANLLGQLAVLMLEGRTSVMLGVMQDAIHYRRAVAAKATHESYSRSGPGSPVPGTDE